MKMINQEELANRAIDVLRSSYLFPKTRKVAERYALLALRRITDNRLALKVYGAMDRYVL